MKNDQDRFFVNGWLRREEWILCVNIIKTFVYYIFYLIFSWAPSKKIKKKVMLFCVLNLFTREFYNDHERMYVYYQEVYIFYRH